MPEPASTIASLSSALENARRALAILERQAAGFTSLSTPVSLQIELEDKRKEVADLERRLGNAAPAETPVPGVPGPVTPDGNAADQHVDPRKLREAMGTAFNKSDFIVLCFDLGVEYENLEGDTLPLRMLSLIKYHQQRGTYSQLVEKVIRERPNLRESLH